MMLHPLTLASIDLQGVDIHTPAGPRFRCGCYYKTRSAEYRLCQYHEGYDDGIEALLAEMRKAVGS